MRTPKINVAENNWGKDTPVYNADKSQILCPENALYLVCYAFYRGQRYSCSALLAAPPFDSAVASGATVRSDDGFLLGSVPAGFDARNGVRPEDLTDAKMQAGGDISIHGKSLLVGKALAAHNVDYDKATVDLSRGSIVGNSKVDAVPDIDLSKLDFTGKSGVQTLTGPFGAKTTLSGLAQGKSLTFSNGLHLDGGVLRLSGNLVVEGGITGRGALIVDGNVTIMGASNLSTDNQVAVLAGGGINVTGTGPSNSYFQGLLYSKGEQGVSVVNSTLLGTLVSTSTTAPVQVERSVIAYDAKMTKIGVDVGFSSADYPSGGFPSAVNLNGGAAYLRLKALPGMPPRSVPTPTQLVQAGVSTLTEANFELDDIAGDPVGGSVSAAFQAAKQKGINSMNRQLAAIRIAAPLIEAGHFALDLNQFLKKTDRLKIVWRR